MKVFYCILSIVILSGCAGMSPERHDINPYTTSDYKQAIESFRGDRYPDSIFCVYGLCRAYVGNKQYEEAIDACQKTILVMSKFKDFFNPKNQFGFDGSESPSVTGVVGYQRSSRNLAMAYSALGRTNEAIATIKKSIELDPTYSEDYVVLATAYNQNKQYDEAITAVKRAIELKSDNAVAYINLGAAYGAKKQYAEAIKALKKTIEIDPKMTTAYDWMGRFLTEQNAYNEAAEAYKKGIEAAPSEPTLHTSLAVAYYRMGKYDDAIAAANKAIELQTFTGIGINYAIESGYPVVKGVMEAGPAKKADIQIGDKIIKIDGKSTKGWTDEKVTQGLRGALGTQVALTVERKGIDKPFEKLITRETIIAKGAALSFGLRSLAYRYKGSLEAALTDAEKAYSLDSANDWARLSLGASYLDRGKYDESIKLLSQIKYSVIARILEATTYAKQGKTKLAVNIYLSIPEEEMFPKNIPLMNDRMALLQTFKPFVKEHRDKARSFESNGQYKEALSELSEALKTADETEAQEIQDTIFSMIRKNPLLAEMPEDARKYALRSEVLVKEGNFEQAVTEIKKAIQIAPYAAQLYYNSALWNAELKKYSEAIRHMKIYIKAVPDAPDARAARDEIIKWEFMMEKGKTF